MNKYLSLIILLLNIYLSAQEKSSLCLTFDDGNPNDIMQYSNDEWNSMILQALKENQLQAAFYVCGKSVDNPQGKKLLQSWDSDGHIIANHTYSHFNYNSGEVTFNKYSEDILSCDSIINGHRNYRKYFRAPYLKSGDTKDKRDSLNLFLERAGYKNGYVTIDASDWFYNSELITFMKNNPGKSIEGYKKPYIQHLLERARYYDDLAYKLLGRKIKHSLLLHHNLTSALFLPALIDAFRKNGWELINASEALDDDVYKKIPDIIPAGESIIWGLAKETGKYEDILRYPGEDSKYEEQRLKSFGLK